MCIFQLARLFERHWTECGVVFLNKNKYNLIRLIERITSQLSDYQNNRYLQPYQDVEGGCLFIVDLFFHIWTNLALYHLLINGSSAVNGNESSIHDIA